MATFLKVLLAIFLPPVSVFLTNGIGLQLLVNIILCLLFVMPGSVHAVWLLVKNS